MILKGCVSLLSCLVLSMGSIFLCPEVYAIPSYEIKGTPTQKRLEALNRQIAINPHDPKPYIDRAEFWIDYMMLSHARNDIERSISIAPTGMAYVWLAKLSVVPADPGDHKTACAYLKKARSVSSQDLQALVHIGLTYSDLKMFDSSTECFDAGLKLHPGDWNLLRWKAQSTMKGGHYKEALAGANYLLSKLPPTKKMEELGKAKETTPDVIYYRLHVDACKVRALCLTALHSYAEALSALNTSLQFTPDDSELYDARATVYRKLGKPNLADADIRKLKKERDFLFDSAPFATDKLK